MSTFFAVKKAVGLLVYMDFSRSVQLKQLLILKLKYHQCRRIYKSTCRRIYKSTCRRVYKSTNLHVDGSTNLHVDGSTAFKKDELACAISSF